MLWNTKRSLSALVLYIRWHFLEEKLIGKTAQQMQLLTMQTCWPEIFPGTS